MNTKVTNNIVAAAALMLAFAANPAAALPYSALYAFGDSLSDTGNISASTLGLVPAPPYSNGRFSNGPVWVEDLNSLLGLAPLQPSLRGGRDFAYGQAKTGATPFQSAGPTDLPGQFGQFAAQTPNPQPGALYTISIGSNDLLNILETPGLTPQAAFVGVASVVQNVVSFVGDLASKGGRDFLLLNVPDLGQTPYVRAEGAGPMAEATMLARLYDTLLVQQLGTLAGLDVKVADVFSLLDSAIANPAAFGFTDAVNPCWTGNYYGFGGSLCSNSVEGQDAHVFWDALHPTERAHWFVAQLAFQDLLDPPADGAAMADAGAGSQSALLTAGADAAGVASLDGSPVNGPVAGALPAQTVADPVPEPGALAVLTAGLMMLALLRPSLRR